MKWCILIYCTGGDLDGQHFVLGPFDNEDRADVHLRELDPEKYDAKMLPLHQDAELADLP